MLPSLNLLEKIQRKIQITPNKQGEYKRKTHYCCYLLCEKAGLRVSEAVNFDLAAKNKHGLYLLNKTKGQKNRYVYIPRQVIKELKKHNWKPNNTNRFNFYHFLRKVKWGLGISKNVELTPHTLRRAFATYQAEAGLPLPLLSKLLGHKSIRTTALYWMNIYHGGDDDDSDVGSILAGKVWLEKPPKPQPEPETPAQVNLDELPELLIPNPLFSEQSSDYLSEIHQLKNQLSQIQGKTKLLEALNKGLKTELSEATEKNAHLENDLAELSEQNTILRHQKAQEATQREQIQQELAKKDQTINQLEQKLAIAENNLTQERQVSQSLRETNTNLTQKLHAGEQDYTNAMVDNYNKRKAEIEKSSDLIKDEELRAAKTEVAQVVKKELEASIGVNVPGVPVNLNAAFKYKIG